jgi:hypothetical protein
LNDPVIWLFAAALIFVPLIASAGSIRNIFMVWRVPTTWISALPSQGWVQIIGRIRGNPIQSRFSKSECAFWQLEVQEYQSSGKGGGRWRTVHKESSGGFAIDDMTGRISIQPGNPSFVLTNEMVIEKPDQAAKLTLQNLGIKTKGFLGFDKRMRIFERLIAIQEEILITGKIQKSEAAISISGNSIVPLVIGNLGKSEMLNVLFKQSVRSLALSLIIGIAVLAFYFYLLLK